MDQINEEIPEKPKFNTKKFIFISFMVDLLIFYFAYMWYVDNQEKKEPIIENTSAVQNYTIAETLDVSCNVDEDCETPGDYLIRSSCPYTSKCLEKKCNVIYPEF